MSPDRAALEYGPLCLRLAKAAAFKRQIFRSDIEDVAQEILMRVVRFAPRYDPRIAAFSTVVARIARNTLCDMARRRYTPKCNRGAIPALLANDAPIVAPDDPLADLERREEIERRLALVDRLLTTRQREVAVAVVKHGHIKAARILGIPLGTTKSIMNRARVRMRRHQAAARQPG